MSTTLVLRLEASKMSRLRDIVSDKAVDLFSRISRAEADQNTNRAEALRCSLAFWNSIDTALRDAQPEPVAVAPSPLCNEANNLLHLVKNILPLAIKNDEGGQWVADARATIARAEGRA